MPYPQSNIQLSLRTSEAQVTPGGTTRLEMWAEHPTGAEILRLAGVIDLPEGFVMGNDANMNAFVQKNIWLEAAGEGREPYSLGSFRQFEINSTPTLLFDFEMTVGAAGGKIGFLETIYGGSDGWIIKAEIPGTPGNWFDLLPGIGTQVSVA